MFDIAWLEVYVATSIIVGFGVALPMIFKAITVNNDDVSQE